MRGDYSGVNLSRGTLNGGNMVLTCFVRSWLFSWLYRRACHFNRFPVSCVVLLCGTNCTSLMGNTEAPVCSILVELGGPLCAALYKTTKFKSANVRSCFSSNLSLLVAFSSFMSEFFKLKDIKYCLRTNNLLQLQNQYVS